MGQLETVIDNGEYTPDEPNCVWCGKSDEAAIRVHNNYSKAPKFRYLAPGQWAHLECYIDLSVHKALEAVSE